MKRVLSLLIAIMLVFLLAGCSSFNDLFGGSDSQGAAEDGQPQVDLSPVSSSDVIKPDAFRDFIKDYIDISHYNEDISESTCYYGQKLDYQPVYAGNDSVHLLSEPIKLDYSTELYYGMPIADFCAQGWTFENPDHATLEIEANMRTLLGVPFIMNDKKIEVKVMNSTDATLTYANAFVGGFDLDQYTVDDNCTARDNSLTDFNIEGAITGGSDLRTVIDTLGEPSTVSYSYNESAEKSYAFSKIEIMYKDYGAGDFIINFSYDGKKIFDISML